MEYSRTGAVGDTTPEAAPFNVKAEPKGDAGMEVTWSAEADFESGIRQFIILRDGQELARVAREAQGPVRPPALPEHVVPRYARHAPAGHAVPGCLGQAGLEIQLLGHHGQQRRHEIETLGRDGQVGGRAAWSPMKCAAWSLTRRVSFYAATCARRGLRPAASPYALPLDGRAAAITPICDRAAPGVFTGG